MNILETSGLAHSFSSDNAVLKGISMEVEEGSIYGFLGPNGAGKTTTLRLILGLLKRQQGEIRIFGRELERHRVETLQCIGSMIETPSVYSHLTATENLFLLQKVYRCPQSRVSEVLELVGLGDTGRKRAGQFSLGMKQRLSIAIALLHEPRLLILDEPTNGLDPNGMIEVRELLRQLNNDLGITIVVSSHLLSEIDRLVSHIGIINRGEMLFQGTLDQLKAQQQEVISVVFDTSDNSRAAEILAAAGMQVIAVDGKLSTGDLPPEAIASVNRQLVTSGIDVYEISIIRNDLERIFIEMVSN